MSIGDEHSLHQPDIGAEHRTLADHRSNPDHAAVTDTHALSNDNMMGRLHVRSDVQIDWKIRDVLREVAANEANRNRAIGQVRYRPRDARHLPGIGHLRLS